MKTKRVYTRAVLQESTNVIDRSKRNVLGRARSKQQLFREFSTAWQSGEGRVWDVESIHRLVITRSSGVWNDVYTYRKRTDASCEIGVLPEHRRFNNHLSLLHLTNDFENNFHRCVSDEYASLITGYHSSRAYKASQICPVNFFFATTSLQNEDSLRQSLC